MSLERWSSKSRMVCAALAMPCLWVGLSQGQQALQPSSPYTRGVQRRAFEALQQCLAALEEIRELAVQEDARETTQQIDAAIERCRRQIEATQLRVASGVRTPVAGPQTPLSPPARDSSGGRELARGQLAPDFNLPRLTIVTEGALAEQARRGSAYRLSAASGRWF
jgi:hypothetical protein